MARESIPTDGKAIQRARQLAGYSSGPFAKRVGISQPYLASIEAGRRNASPELLRRIADNLDKKIVDFVSPELRAAA